MKNNKILFIAGEGVPFIATGGLGEVVGALPRAMMAQESGMDVRVIMPYYRDIALKNTLDYIGYTYISLSWRNQYCGVFKGTVDNVIYYFIDNEYYFKRQDCYGHYDDGERFAFFCKAALEVLPLIDFFPDVIHAHDWQTALAPVYLKTIFAEKYPFLRSVFTIHNIEYQGKYDKAIISDVFALPEYYQNLVEYDGCMNLLKGAIECADLVSTVSPTYAGEIFNPYYSHGLTPIIERNASKMRGILNGIDTDFYNPDTDTALFENYNVDTMDKKKQNKIRLQEMLGLQVNGDIPMLAVISRLVGHKGMDLITQAIDDVLSRNVQLVVLGKGDWEYERFFVRLQQRYPGKAAVRIEFSADLSRKIYAGADIFLMPSQSEPCGLAQMIASRYGTVPIVRETGGLKDTIHDCSLGEGNGFTFYDYTAYNVVNAVNRALERYDNKDDWSKLVSAVMRADFSWNRSAEEYIQMYQEL